MINIATDGPCKCNPGVGGWGVAVFDGDLYLEGLSGGEVTTTNNRMELMAFIQACNYIEENFSDESDLTIWIDSMYVIKGCTEWLRGWRAKDYKGVKNEDLWREIADLRCIWKCLNLQWVKGHSGNLFNDKADKLANEGCILDDGW